MPWYVSDKGLWAAVLFAAGFVAVYAPATLDYIRDATVTPEARDTAPTKQLQKDAEQAISTSTLRVLADGYSHDIRAAATKVVANRTVNSHTRQLLLKDLRSKDETRRGNAITALRMLIPNQDLKGQDLVGYFIDDESYHSIVTALKNVLNLHKRPSVSSPPATTEKRSMATGMVLPSSIMPDYRPEHERPLLMLLQEMLVSQPVDGFRSTTSNVSMALRAGLVRDWLKDYPFPCALPENASHFTSKKSDVCSLFERRPWPCGERCDEPCKEPLAPMTRIIQLIMRSAEGKKELRDAGLLASIYTEEGIGSKVRRRTRTVSDIDGDIRMTNGESTAGAVTLPSSWELLGMTVEDIPQRRSFETSREEEHLRRRNRQAVVVAEAGAPLTRDNILQRPDSMSPSP